MTDEEQRQAIYAFAHVYPESKNPIVREAFEFGFGAGMAYKKKSMIDEGDKTKLEQELQAERETTRRLVRAITAYLSQPKGDLA